MAHPRPPCPPAGRARRTEEREEEGGKRLGLRRRPAVLGREHGVQGPGVEILPADPALFPRAAARGHPQPGHPEEVG